MPFSLAVPDGVCRPTGGWFAPDQRVATRGDSQLEVGVYIGGALLVGLVVVRQVIALRETVAYAQDTQRLNDALRAMSNNNEALTTANTQLEVMATTDALTALPNRTLLHDRLGLALRAAKRDPGTMALLLLDLDRFKEVNDTLGHRYGDLLLQQASLRLQDTVRVSDTVARLGGDEFAVLLPTSDVAQAATVAHKILTALDTPFLVDGHTIDVGVSIGIAGYPDHGADSQTLLRHADVAMYMAKRAHSGCAIYDATQDHHSAHRLTLMSELRQALTDGQLLLHYQPLVDLRSGSTRSVEALLRWSHPSTAPSPPPTLSPWQNIPASSSP